MEEFPVELFRYLFHRNASSLDVEVESRISENWFDATGKQSALAIACSNKKMSPEVVQLIMDLNLKMVEHEDIGDGCLPLHTLCRNSMLNEQSAIEIMKLLVTKYPESLRKKLESKCRRSG